MVAGAGLLCWAAPPGSSAPGSDIQAAIESLQAGRYGQAEALATELASRCDQPCPRAWIVVADARAKLGQYASAVRAYQLFLASCDSPEMRDYASRQMRQCELVLSPSPAPGAPSKALSADDKKDLATVSDDLFTESTEHFVVKTHNAKLSKIVAAESETALGRICRGILPGQEYPHVVQVNVWRDHDEFARHAVAAEDWASGRFCLDNQDGTIIRRIDLTQLEVGGQFSDVMLDRVLPHEMCHLVLKESFGDVACPLFLNEGLAMTAEAEVDNNRVLLAGAALSGGGRIDLDQLFIRGRSDMGDVSTFYAESFSFASFLHRKMTPEQLRAFLDHLKNGCTVSDALQRSYYMPLDEAFAGKLESAWQEYAITQAQYVHALRDSLASR